MNSEYFQVTGASSTWRLVSTPHGLVGKPRTVQVYGQEEHLTYSTNGATPLSAKNYMKQKLTARLRPEERKTSPSAN